MLAIYSINMQRAVVARGLYRYHTPCKLAALSLDYQVEANRLGFNSVQGGRLKERDEGPESLGLQPLLAHSYEREPGPHLPQSCPPRPRAGHKRRRNSSAK